MSSPLSTATPVIQRTSSSGVASSLGEDTGDPAVEEDVHAVTELVHLTQVVAHEDHADVLLPHLADQILDLALLDDGQRGGRLVEQEHLLTPCHRTGHRDRLPLAPREDARSRANVRDPDAQRRKRSARLLGHCGPVEHPELLPDEAGPANLPPEEDVLRDRQLGREGEILVDDLDPLVARLAGRVEDDLLAVDEEGALRGTDCAAEDLEERRLAGSVVAHEPDDLAALDLDVDVLQCGEAAVVVRDPLRGENRVGRIDGLGRDGAHRSALRASWSVSTARIRSTPITMYCV